METPSPENFSVSFRFATPSKTDAAPDANDGPGRDPLSGAPPVAEVFALKGFGPTSTKPFALGARLYRISFSHQGSGPCVVRLRDTGAKVVDTLLQKQSPVSLTKTFTVKAAGQYSLTIDANGEWTAYVRESDADASFTRVNHDLRMEVLENGAVTITNY